MSIFIGQIISVKLGAQTQRLVMRVLGKSGDRVVVEANDETDAVLQRVNDHVRALVQKTHVRVVRVSSGRPEKFFAAVGFNRCGQNRLRTIAIDYPPSTFSSNEESFIIAHEIGHLKHNHGLIIAASTAAIVTGPLVIFRHFTHYPIPVALGVAFPALLGLTVLGYLVVMRRVERYLEFDADDYAIRFSNEANCLAVLKEIRRHIVISPGGRFVQDMDKRITRVCRTGKPTD